MRPGEYALDEPTSEGDPPTETDQLPIADDEQEPEPVPPIPMLQVAVYEAAGFLAAAEDAIVASNHAVVVATTGRDGVVSVAQALASGGIDVRLVGMPGGELVIDAAHMVTPRRPVVIAAYDGSGVDGVGQGNAEGADLVTLRPHDADRLSLALLAAARLLDDRRTLQGGRLVQFAPRVRSEELRTEDARGLQRFDVFQRVLELELRSARTHRHPLAVGLFALELPSPEPSTAVIKLVRARATIALIDAMREIDLATELDHDRFLILFPYTELAEASSVAHRVIAEVAAGAPVIAEGWTIAPRLIGAVAAAEVGQPPSFARLMHDAASALEQARRDGIALAVSVSEGA